MPCFSALQLPLPRAIFLHVIRLLPNPVGKAKTIKYLETSTLQSIRLAVEDFRSPFVNNTCVDATTSSPRGGHEAMKVQHKPSGV